MTELIYKIFRLQEWAAFEAAGRFDGSSDDRRDGFIHFSKAEQVAGTLERYYAQEDRVAIAAFPADRLGDALKWETSRGDQLFPHLYAPLFMAQLDNVRWVEPRSASAPA